VPEYGRDYSERCGRKLGDRWESWEFRHIARVQAQREDDYAERANRLLFCDTDVFTTARFHEAYVGARDPELERLARSRHYDLYLLCALDAPFVQDGWRDDGPHRVQMDQAYRRFLVENGARWVELTDPYDARFAQASAAVDLLLAESAAA
jgi:nicotinamide riboside kinase